MRPAGTSSLCKRRWENRPDGRWTASEGSPADRVREPGQLAMVSIFPPPFTSGLLPPRAVWNLDADPSARPARRPDFSPAELSSPSARWVFLREVRAGGIGRYRVSPHFSPRSPRKSTIFHISIAMSTEVHIFHQQIHISGGGNSSEAGSGT